MGLDAQREKVFSVEANVSRANVKSGQTARPALKKLLRNARHRISDRRRAELGLGAIDDAVPVVLLGAIKPAIHFLDEAQ